MRLAREASEQLREHAMDGFVYTALPSRVIFGSGTLARVADEVRHLGGERALLLATPQQTEQVQGLADALGGLSAGIFPEATMHTPVEVTERALAMVRETGADCIIALGGGSTTGLAKAIALRTDLPQVVIPTTYAGSEATPILGETSGGRKVTQRTLAVLPEVIVYDVDLTLSLPPGLSVTSGINAIAHAVEALYAREANPVTSLLAEQGIATLAGALPDIVRDPTDKRARSDALFGAWACGVCLGSVGMALHHKLCHTLGGSFDLPHAETHTVVLPHAVTYNAQHAGPALERVARALGTDDAAGGLFDLARALGAPTSLRELGMPEEGLDRAAELAAADPYWNPRPIERDAIRSLLEDAFRGRRPEQRSAARPA
jgi:maleylacetate reductase